MLGKLSPWGRRIALGVTIVAGVLALANAQVDGKVVQWSSQFVGTEESQPVAFAILVLVGAVVGHVVGFLFDVVVRTGAFRAARERVYIEVIGMPDCDIPEWVERAWVGTILPLAAGREEPRSVSARSVVTGRSLPHRAAYVVLADEAMEVLEKQAPHAAEWWRANAPQMFGRGKSFAFEAAVCRKIGVDEMAVRIGAAS